MKKLLILIVFAAVYLHFYPQPELNALYERYKSEFLASVSAATDTKVRLKSDKIFKDLQPEFKQFSESEINRLREITASRESVDAFYEKYCKNDDYDSVFHAINLRKVCKTIDSYKGLL